jgi:hypothetical protein
MLCLGMWKYVSSKLKLNYYPKKPKPDKMKLKIFIVIFTATILFGCSDNKKSKVVSFEYGGHYDTSCAILEGEVYRPNPQPSSKDSLLPMSGAMIQSFDSAKRLYKTTLTDLYGKFNMSFFNEGTFSLKVLKVGYQTLDVTNYNVDTGQTSTVKIILEKDNSIF